MLTGCSPGVNGLAAIGLDGNGNLIGGSKVCATDSGHAELSRGVTSLARWDRSTKGHGTEIWQLTPATDGSWARSNPTHAQDPASGPGMSFRVDSWGGGWNAAVDVTEGQLAALAPGHLLVEVAGPPDPSGYSTTVTKVIPVEELADQPCPDG